MNAVWVDTDFGFDDLWALLVLRHFGCPIAGVSLVAGNAPLEQVCANALGAYQAYGFDWPLWKGADRPLVREPETAQRILGPRGMRSRGAHLPDSTADMPSKGATEALSDWVMQGPDDGQEILTLGPLTNIAHLVHRVPDLRSRIARLIWMGGSAGRGNHTQKAEYNAVADAEALACVIEADLPLVVVDLTFCRQVTFAEPDMPRMDPLTKDLLGGYLDIALDRGRAGMAIYDPLAALAVARPDLITCEPCKISVSTETNDSYGATAITPTAGAKSQIATHAQANLAQICLAALQQEPCNGPR